MTVLYDDTYSAWENYTEPRWIHGPVVDSPMGDDIIFRIRISGGYIYGFVIYSESANDFRLIWVSNNRTYSIRISLPSPGTVQLSNTIPINEGLPATGEVYIRVVDSVSGKCRASLLVSSSAPVEVLPLPIIETPNWFVTAAYVAKKDPRYPLKSKAMQRACVHEYGKGYILTGRLLWSYRLAENTWIKTSCSADIDGDGNVEIIVPPGEYGRYVYCLNGKDGSVKWLYDTGYSNYWESAGVVAHDIDGDGNMEIIICAFGQGAQGYGGKIHCIAHDGTVKWTYTPPGPGWMSESPIHIYDVDDDGKLEIIVSSFDDSSGNMQIGIFSTDGTLKKSWSIPATSVGLSVADIDADGSAEIVAPTYGGIIMCFTKNGEVKWTYYAQGNSIPGTLFDVDGDGKLEVLTGDGYNFMCLNCDGTLRWKYTSDDRIIVGAYGVYDIDGDGYIECVAAHYDTMYCLYADDGSLKWSYGGLYRIRMPGCLADLDSDGNYEVFFYSDGDFKAFCLEHDGTLKWYYSYEYLYSYPLEKYASIDDVNGDGKLEAVAPVGATYKVLVFGSD